MSIVQKIPVAVKGSVDLAIDRAIVDAGSISGLIPGGFTALVQSMSGAGLWAFNQQAGTSYTWVQGDLVVAMSDDAARTISIPDAAPAGSLMVVLDNSGSSTAGHTITVSAPSSTINGNANALVTPGTNKVMWLVSDGANYWILFRA